jgi:hypothetical protein
MKVTYDLNLTGYWPDELILLYQDGLISEEEIRKVSLNYFGNILSSYIRELGVDDVD